MSLGHQRNFAFALVLIFVSVQTCTTAQAASITNLGVLSGGTASYAYGVSADGRAVVGTSGSLAGNRAFRWTAVSGMEDLAVLPGGAYSYGNAISADGSAVAGTSASPRGSRAFRWTSAEGMRNLGSLGGYGGTSGSSTGYAVSGNGSAVVGQTSSTDGFIYAFRWTSAGGLQRLASFATSYSAVAYSISADGSVVVGSADVFDSDDWVGVPCRWTATGGIQQLGNLWNGSATATNSDGSVIVGTVGRIYGGGHDIAFRWTDAGGFQNLGTIAGGYSPSADAVSGDGLVIAGSDYPDNIEHAFLWSTNLRMVDLNTYLPSLGVDLAGWILKDARGLSYDGSVIVGNGTYNGQPRGWIAVVPEPALLWICCLGGVLARRSRSQRNVQPNRALSRWSGQTLASVVVALGLTCGSAHAQWVTWELAAGGNGHRYQAVPGNQFLTWEMADQLAQAQSGYLATITSAAENDFVFSLIDAAQFWNDWINGSGPAIGGVQLPGSPEPQDGWQWISGEAWSYTNWFPGQPDDGAGGPSEDRLHYFSGFQIGVRSSTWNDIAANDANLGGFVIEAVPEPAAVALLAVGALLARRRVNVG